MKNFIKCRFGIAACALVLLTQSLLPSKSLAAEESDDGNYSTTQFGLELLGMGGLYSLMGSYRFTPNAVVNAGLSYYSLSASSGGATANVGILLLPISFSYLLGGKDHFFEALGGGDIVVVSGTATAGSTSVTGSASGFVPVIGAGYRYWPWDGGFHFRGTAYMLFSAAQISPWIGLSFGYALEP